MVALIDILKTTQERNASDLILTSGARPILRVDKQLTTTELPVFQAEDIERLIFSILTDEQKESLIRRRELNFSYSLSGVSRFRTNVFFQRNSLGAVFRRIAYQLPTMQELNLPVKALKKIASMRSGLVIVTGPMMSGKSTTIAAIIEMINKNERRHIITIEDPIEYLFTHDQSIIEQREIGPDTKSFFAALSNAVRQSPDIIMIGEMRDTETVQAAIGASETGLLVLSTLHTPNSSETVNRIIDFFPAERESQIRSQLAGNLSALISQQLIPATGGRGLVAACEILIGSPNVKTLIREGTAQQLQNVIETGTQQGMQSMDNALHELFQKRFIDKDDYCAFAHDKARAEKATLEEA